MMFAQANSEHCRHKIFNADWTIDGEAQDKSLFGMIRNTHQLAPKGTVVAYSDNASVIEGAASALLPARRHQGNVYEASRADPHPDEGGNPQPPDRDLAVPGRLHRRRRRNPRRRRHRPRRQAQGRPDRFTVSNLMVPTPCSPGKTPVTWPSRPPSASHAQGGIYGKPERIASPLQIMIEGPLGGAAFNNEFGRPNLGGYFHLRAERGRPGAGYHKPIMIAGGLGNISAKHTKKNDLPVGSLLIQLGGPGMRIGMGGGAASSMATGTNTADLDFDSVQRGNPEMERRAQEVINACWALGDDNPILSIHDVGAGGLSNAFPEITNDAKRGALFDLRKVPLEESGLAPRRSGATSPRNATCWPSAEHLDLFKSCASASAPASPWSVPPPKNAS
jgi:phosphoribosylformylglycinamidine synthase